MIVQPRNTITKRVFAIAMTLFFLLPLSVDAIHLLSHDSHTHCAEVGDIHFHEAPVDCDMCDLHTTSILTLPEIVGVNVVITPIAYAQYFYHKPVAHSFQKASFYLRGPPQMTV